MWRPGRIRTLRRDLAQGGDRIVAQIGDVCSVGLSLPICRLRAARRHRFRHSMAGDMSVDPRVGSAPSGWE